MEELCRDLANTLSCAGNGGLCYAGLNKSDPCDCRLLLETQCAMLARLPPVVCLCGSTRFGDAFREANLRLTLAGQIVLSIGCEWHGDDALGLTEADKERLDELHLKKIDICDYVYVLNVGGYIGESTRREIAYAEGLDKPVRYLEAVVE